MAKISVVIPCYNQGQYLKDAVDSVLASTFKDVEIIIVDDGSTVDADLIDAIKGENIKVIHQENQGVCIAKNNGIKIATSEYILPLDADDKVHPTYIEKALNILEKNKDIGIVYGDCEFFGSKTGKWELKDYSLSDLLVSNMLLNSSMYKKSDWEKVGGYNPSMDSGFEDWEFWVNMVENGVNVYKIHEVLFSYRQFDNTRTISAEENRFKLIKKIMKLHPNIYIDNFEDILVPFFQMFVPKVLKKQLFSLRLQTKIFGRSLYFFLEKPKKEN